jgi:cell division transport system permease protein
MLAWLNPPAPDRRLLPGGRLQGPTPYVIAIMMFVTIIIAAAGLALANAADIVARGVENRYSIQIAGGARLAPRAIAAARSVPGVTDVRPISEQELRRTLERWLGPAGLGEDLPIPALIDVDLAPGASPQAVASAVERAVPGAKFVAHSTSLGPLLRAITAMQWLAAALVAMMVLATSAAVVLAARGALDTNRATIDVMHGIGATDDQIVHLFQRRIALDALTGGVGGGTAAGLILLFVAGGGSAMIHDLAGGAALGLGDIALLIAMPFAGAALATWVARRAVLKALRDAV